MRDIELYRALLGLTAPWTVAGVDVDMTGQRVVVRVDAGPGPYPCPECETPGPRYDSKPRRWRHLDTMQFTTWIEAEVPRVECAAHGVKQLRVPWAEPGSAHGTRSWLTPCVAHSTRGTSASIPVVNCIVSRWRQRRGLLSYRGPGVPHSGQG